MLEGLRYVTINDAIRNRKVLVCYPLRKKDQSLWGVLSPLENTIWGKQIPMVSGEVLSHALHGHAKPLLETLGRPPKGRAVRLPLKDRWCFEYQQKICSNANEHCLPGSGQMPGCYIPPGSDPKMVQAARAVAIAWDEGRYVFLVEGDEFIIR